MILQIEQNTSKWLEYRKDKFNASEAGAVMGVGFIKPYQLAQIKYQNKQIYQNEAMRQGHEYEPKIREYVNEKFRLNLNPCVMQSDDDARFSASLDGLDIFTDTICEIKFSKNEYEQVKTHNKPSQNYFYQIQHQFFVSRAKKCIFAVGYINDDFELEVITIEILPDKKAIKALIKAWDEFEATYKPDDGLDGEWLEISNELSDINAQIKQLQTKADELKQKAIQKANGKEIKAYSLTVYQTIRKDTPDYKAYCEYNGITIPSEFIKPGSQSWAVRITA